MAKGRLITFPAVSRARHLRFGLYSLLLSDDAGAADRELGVVTAEIEARLQSAGQQPPDKSAVKDALHRKALSDPDLRAAIYETGLEMSCEFAKAIHQLEYERVPALKGGNVCETTHQ